MIHLPAGSLKLDGSGRRALIILLVIYVSCCALGGPSPLPAPPHARAAPAYPLGNMTLVDKPVDIVRIERGQIPVGRTWTYIYKLRANRTYHIYLLGDWANLLEHRTDYDILVYEVSGRRLIPVSSHTEAAGLPEQVGNDGYGRYFRPSRSGTYYFNVVNDPLESSAAEAGTLMAIEHIEANRWYSLWMHGKVDEEPVRETTWAYEFNTSADRIRVYVDVPSTLDMYEARLYVMANPAAEVGGLLNGIPVAWEPGLRGERSGVYGGFNFDPQGFRHVDAMASCEHSGEDMVIDYAAPVGGDLLYHLVLIAEYFSGTVRFIVQTDFDPPALQLIDPPASVEADEPTSLEAMVSDETSVKSVSLRYSTDGGRWREVEVDERADGVYGGVIPALAGGTVVQYVFEAEDEIGNAGAVNGSYIVMSRPRLELRLDEDAITGGENVTARGHLDLGGEEVVVSYAHGGAFSNFTVTTDGSGRFSHTFTPDKTGDWQVSAHYAGDETSHPATSETLGFTVSSRSTSLTCTLSDEEIPIGEEVTISGEFSLDMEGLTVELTLATADNVTTLVAKTDADGRYNATFEPDAKGTWRIRAEIQGDGFRYEGAESAAVELAVVAPSLTSRILRPPSFLLRPPYLYGVVGGVGGGVGVAVFLYRRRE